MASTAKKSKKNSKSTTKAKAKLEQVLSTAKRFAVKGAEVKSKAAMRKEISENRRLLKSWGRAAEKIRGVTVYANKQLSLVVTHAKHVKGAKRSHDNECVVARAVRDSVMGPHITDVYVGNATVKLKSALNPDVEVKFLLDNKLYGAIDAWDRTGKWQLKDGVYWLNAYPPSLRDGYRRKPKKDEKPGARKSRAKKSAPTRHISLRKDIDRAMVLAAYGKKAKKKPAA